MRTRLFAALLALSAVAVAACSGGSLVVRRPEQPAVDQALTALWEREVREVARSGDWLLTRSYSVTGDVIALATAGESVSHASIYDAERGTIIEALSPEVREVSLASLIRRNHVIIVVRPAGQGEAEGRAAVARARSVVGAPFDYLGIFGAGSEARFYCSELVAWASRSPVERDAVLTPAELVGYGEVVYYSGQRDEPGVQAAAWAGRSRKAASVLHRAGLEVDEQPVAHGPQHREVGELGAALEHLHRVAAQRGGADADDAPHRHDVLALEALHLRVEGDQPFGDGEELRPAPRVLVDRQEVHPLAVQGAREGGPDGRRDLVHPVEAGGVEAAARAQAGPDGEVGRRQHGLEQLELLLEQDLHAAGAIDRVAGGGELVSVDGNDRFTQLVHHQLHPDLLDLVNALEHQLVRMGPLVRHLL
jgi:hypothetical protein